jgi:hypothetical protein
VDTPKHFALAIVVPAVVAMLVLGVGWRLTRRRLGRRDSATLTAELATALGFVAGWIVLLGPGEFPSADASGWLLWLGVPLTLVMAVARAIEVPFETRLLLIAVAVAAVFGFVAWPRATGGGLDHRAVCWHVAIAAMLTWFTIAAMDTLGERLTFRRTQLVWLAATASASAVLLGSGERRPGEIELLLVGAGLGCLATTVLTGRSGNGQCLASVVGLLHGGNLLAAHLSAGLNSLSAVLLLLAPCAAWLAEPLAHQRHGADGTRRAAIQLLLVLAAAALPLWYVWHNV